ncbi:unnamed protein product [Cylindrotheca closterium]|uniref:Uncharacterized protein n=1 Tax=Cylindrotheca closterium TaxID=2856 RepID=A0AAD2CHZ6_9STRA|nr:unnamed protein product [Cylindrotheca closterium]
MERLLINLPIVVATPPPEEKKLSKKCIFAIAFFVLVVAVGGGIAAWQSGKSSAEGQLVTQYAPPTEEDCLAVSQGLHVEGQNSTALNQVGLEMNFVVGSNVNIELLGFKASWKPRFSERFYHRKIKR